MDSELKLKWMYRPNDIYTELSPLTSMEEFWRCKWQLHEIFAYADSSAWVGEQLYFRGDSSCRSLGDKRWAVSTEKLMSILDTCRQHKLIECNDNTLYLLMRHAGVKYTALLDWTMSPEIAVWFAIHDTNGRVKENGDAALWVYRPIAADEAKYNGPDGELFPENGGMRSVVYFPYENPQEFEGLQGYIAYQRPTMQEALAVRLRFSEADARGNRHLVPMDEDPNFKGRLLKIGIEGDFKSIEAELTDWLHKERNCPKGGFPAYLGLDLGDDQIAKDMVNNNKEYVVSKEMLTKLNDDFENEVNQ